jgi:hypothetical protein
MHSGRNVSVLIVAAAAAAAVGCVDRRFVVTSNTPAARVTVDGDQLGPTPVDARYEYTGVREFRAYAPGYQPLVQRIKFEPRWYDYPGLDLFAEVFWPFRIEDVRRVHLELQPACPVPVEQLQAAAEQLRQRGLSLPPPSIPNDQPGATGPRPAAADPWVNTTGSTPIPPVGTGRFGGR